MTNQQHPITPPPKLVEKWMDAPDWLGLGCHPGRSVPDETYAKRLVEAAQWGADQELEACVDFIQYETDWDTADKLRAARRSKPPSLAEEALALINHDPANQPFLSKKGIDTLRCALERLQQLEDQR